MSIAALLLGSNVGDRFQYIETAISYIETQTGKVIKKSSLVETAPWGNTSQGNFINLALLIETEMNPHQLIKTLLEIEIQIGRKRIEKWGPRIIDIDILYYEDLRIDEPDLKIPHPFMQDRRFTLIPLNEISPEWVHPVFHKTVGQLLDACNDNGEVAVL